MSTTESSGNSDLDPAKKKHRTSRSKYTRPCDACSFRKVKCDLNTPCSRCKNHDIPCTFNRVRKKCGPKKIHEKTRNLIVALNQMTVTNKFTPMIPIDKLLPYLQIYQTWYYGVWPVVSVADLITRLVNAEHNANSDSVSAYSLACAISAAIFSQVVFITSNSHLAKLPEDIKVSDFVNECIKSRETINYRLKATSESLLTSFFLYLYYVNLKGGIHCAITYLRESISFAQLMGLHNVHTYREKSSAETHRFRKIYYLLLVTERFMCIEDNVPVILESTIPFPSLNDEEYSNLLTGFTELVKVFAIPDKQFFEKICKLKFEDVFDVTSKQWITDIQLQLSRISIAETLPETQKLNIILSKYWMESLTWHISLKNQILNNTVDCLTYDFPIEIAKNFLQDIRHLSIFAFESNGPGVCIKLLELATGIVDSLELKKEHTTKEIGFNYLSSIFSLISRLKNDISLPTDMYEKIENIIKTRSFASKTGYISELDDTSSDGSYSIPSPFTQMANAFSMSLNAKAEDPIDLSSFKCEPEYNQIFNGVNDVYRNFLSASSDKC